MVQVPATQSSSSDGDDPGSEDEGTERSLSEIPNSQPPTPPPVKATPPVKANPWSAIPKKDTKLQLITRLGFDDKRAYHDFRVYHLSFKLTLDLVKNTYGRQGRRLSPLLDQATRGLESQLDR